MAREDATLSPQGFRQQNSPFAEVCLSGPLPSDASGITLLLPKHIPFLKSPSHSLNGRFLLCSLQVSLSHKYGDVFVFPQTWIT